MRGGWLGIGASVEELQSECAWTIQRFHTPTQKTADVGTRRRTTGQIRPPRNRLSMYCEMLT